METKTKKDITGSIAIIILLVSILIRVILTITPYQTLERIIYSLLH